MRLADGPRGGPGSLSDRFIYNTPLFLFFEVFQKLPPLHPPVEAFAAVHAPVGSRLVNVSR
jgi:hypothetical protein